MNASHVEPWREPPEPRPFRGQGRRHVLLFGFSLTAAAACLSGLAYWWIEDQLRVPAIVSAQVIKGSAAARRPAASNDTPDAKAIEPAAEFRVAQAVAVPPPQAPRTEEPVRATLGVPATLTLVAGGTSPFAFSIEPAILARGSGTLVFRGLPQGVSLIYGSSDPTNAWRVALAETSQLVFAAADPTAGPHEITIELRSRENVLLASARSTLVIPQSTASEPMSGPARASEDATRQWLAEGRRLITQGHVAAARLLLRRAADNGLGEAALALGDTYDPAKLYALGVRGMSGDVSQAILWYERADELGESLAKSRLIGMGTP